MSESCVIKVHFPVKKKMFQVGCIQVVEVVPVEIELPIFVPILEEIEDIIPGSLEPPGVGIDAAKY